ncbi:MAG: hypothetical protein OXH57_00795, partial [Ekhidna sp.]|nr:hypothetical protein [Ekhidna sp.]
PIVINVEISKISKLSKQISALKKSDPSSDTIEFEAQIDQLVYELYDLTDEEIAIVEGKTKKT